MFCTQAIFPPDWEQVEGRILNKCFVDYRTVEKRIGSSLVFFDRLRRYDLESVVSDTLLFLGRSFAHPRNGKEREIHGQREGVYRYGAALHF